MSDEKRADWMCGVCGNLNGVGMSAAPMNCMRCGLMRGARAYPAYCPSCGKTVNDRCGHEGLTITVPAMSLPAPRSSSTGTPRCPMCGHARHYRSCEACRANGVVASACVDLPVAPPSREPCPDDPPCDECVAIRDGIEDAPTPELLPMHAAGVPRQEDYERILNEAALGRSLLAALETVEPGTDSLRLSQYWTSTLPGACRRWSVYVQAEDGSVVETPDATDAATRALAAELQRVKG